MGPQPSGLASASRLGAWAVAELGTATESQDHAHIAAVPVGDRQIGNAIAVEVADRDEGGSNSGGIRRGRVVGAQSIGEEDAHGIAAVRGPAIEVGHLY